MRLESQYQTTAWESAPSSSKRCDHFNRMVTIVINHSDRATLRQRQFAIALEATADPAEFTQRLDDRVIRRAHFGGHRNGSERVLYVMHTRQIKRDRQARHRAVPTHRRKVHTAVVGTYIFSADIGLRIQTITHNLFGDLRDDFVHIRIIGAQYSHTIERQAFEKINKGLLQFAEVMAIGFHMVGIDVGHHRNHRR